MSIKTKHNKKVLLDALEKSLGVVSSACMQAGISRKTYYEYYNTDEEFRKKADETADIALDFVESKLFERVKKGGDAAIIFYLKTKGKKRGYIERTETADVTNEYKNMSQDERQREFEQAQEAIEKIRLKKVG